MANLLFSDYLTLPSARIPVEMDLNELKAFEMKIDFYELIADSILLKINNSIFTQCTNMEDVFKDKEDDFMPFYQTHLKYKLLNYLYQAELPIIKFTRRVNEYYLDQTIFYTVEIAIDLDKEYELYKEKVDKYS